METNEKLKQMVKEKYGEIAESNSSCCEPTSCCGPTSKVVDYTIMQALSARTCVTAPTNNATLTSIHRSIVCMLFFLAYSAANEKWSPPQPVRSYRLLSRYAGSSSV